MKINAVSNIYNIGFSSLRTDKNNIETLKNGSLPILDNKKDNILASLNALANNPERTSIEFLLDIAQNLNYGQTGNSEFKDIIDETTDVVAQRENTDWSQVISDTIRLALSKSIEDVSDLEVKYEQLFNTKQPLTDKQKEVLDLRNQLKKTVVSENALEDAETLNRCANVSKNIDLFISSSEISLEQKKECLEKFLYFFSDDYAINPQLKDKKVQIIDEMLNDLLIKVPGQSILTIKGVNQLFSGICAAISFCRKSIAYEDKSRYMDIVLEELKDSPTMEVFDVTDLGSGKTVNIPKINIDYDSAILQGYRILDASAHHWMQNAHSSGDGSIQSETYTAFDDDTYGIFNDSSWYEGFNPDWTDEKALLKNLIKEKELLDSVLKQRKKIKDATLKVIHTKKQRTEIQSAINGELLKTFASIFPELSQGDITKLIRSIISFYNGSQDDNQVNISDKMPKEVKELVLSDFIKKHINIPPDDEVTNTAINNNSKKILDCIEKYTEIDNEIKKLSDFNSKKAQFAYYRKMFQLAAAHRLAFEADVNLSTGIVRFEKISGLPTRTEQITSYLQDLSQSLKNPDVAQFFLQGKTNSQIEKEIAYDIIRMKHHIPKQLDDISMNVFGLSIKEQTVQMLSDMKEQIKFGRKDFSSMVSSLAGIKNEKTQVINYLDRLIKKFDGDISEREIDEAIRILGFEDRIHMFKTIFAQFVMNLNSGISSEEMEVLANRFGGEDKVATSIQQQQNKFVELVEMNNQILERWQVPSARQLIIERAEKDNKILSLQKLDILRNKFDTVRSQQSKNDSIENIKDRKKANNKLYEFSNDELTILHSIEKSLPYMKKYCKMEYGMANKEMFEELERQYAQIGMLNGQFWVREEGSSGLSANEQVRIIEQMTGKPYHIERDIENAVKHIKKGDGSGVITYSVDDESYAFHAQYVPAVTSETRISPKTGDKSVDDIVWTDNSWGKAEKEYFWDGRDGFKYTDYGSGYGWKNGFILSDDLKIGQSVTTLKTSTGLDSKDKDEFSLFLDMVLPGTPVDAYQKLYKMFSYILSMEQGSEYYSALETALMSGNSINPANLERLDQIVEDKTILLNRQIDNIKSREEFDKLPPNSRLRFVLDALSLYMATTHPVLADSVLLASNSDELQKIKESMLDELVDEFGSIICKSDETIDKLLLVCNSDINSVFDKIKQEYNIDYSKQERSQIIGNIFSFSDEVADSLDGTINKFESVMLNQVDIVAKEKISDENARQLFISDVHNILKKEIDEYLKIKSLDSPILVNSPLHEEFIAAIDKYLSPSSDKELLDLIIGLQNSDYEKANVFLSVIDYDDVGLNFKDPYDYIKLLKTGDSAATKAFGQIVASLIITNLLESFNLDSDASVQVSQEDDEDIQVDMTAADLYRALYVKLSEMDVQKYIRDFKAEAFLKYKVRQAFPEPVVLKDEEIAKTCIQMYDYFNELMIDIRKNDFIISVFDKYSQLQKISKKSELFRLINTQEPVYVDSSLKSDYDNILKFLTDFSDLLSEDESLALIKLPVDSLISAFCQNDAIDSKAICDALAELQDVFKTWEISNIVKKRFVQSKKEDIAEIKNSTALLVNSNVVPKYRNEAFERVNKIVSLMKNGKYDAELEYEENEFIDFLIKRHIIKEPTKLLSECVNMVQSGQSESQSYTILKSYLIRALKVAQQTKAQYKMVQNAHDGISSKTKDLLPLFNITLADGTKESMNSEMGMIYLINQLENESDDHATLKLFLAQSGLAKLSLNALINNFNGDKSVEIIDETYNQIMLDIKDFEYLNQIIDNFMQLRKIPFKNLDDAIKQLRDFVARKTKNNPESKIFEKYLEYIDSVQVKKELKNVSSDIILPLLVSFNKDAVSYAGESVNTQIDYLVGISKLLEDRKLLIEIIDVPTESEEYNRRVEFREEYEQLQQSIKDKLSQIQEKIENSEFMSAEYIED